MGAGGGDGGWIWGMAVRRWCCWRATADATRGACVRVADGGNATETKVGFDEMSASIADGDDDDAAEVEVEAPTTVAIAATVPVTGVDDDDGEVDKAAAVMTEGLMAATTASPGVSFLFLRA